MRSDDKHSFALVSAHWLVLMVNLWLELHHLGRSLRCTKYQVHNWHVVLIYQSKTRVYHVLGMDGWRAYEIFGGLCTRYANTPNVQYPETVGDEYRTRNVG